MRTLIVGAGAVGGYLGAKMIAAGRDVTFLVHPGMQARLNGEGLRVRRSTGIETTAVNAVTVCGLHRSYDTVVIAVRTDAAESAITDIHGAVGSGTRIVPLMNGIRHLSMLTAAFGQDAVLGATARCATSQLLDGTIDEIVPGIQLEMGQLDGGHSEVLSRTATQFDVQGVTVALRRDAVAAMWEKFAFITCTAVLTCLIGEVIGPIADAQGGPELARAVLSEVASVAAAEQSPMADPVLTTLEAFLTDPSSAFSPSLFRDMRADRPIEATVLRDLAERARCHGIATPLLDAVLVVVDVHNHRIAA